MFRFLACVVLLLACAVRGLRLPDLQRQQLTESLSSIENEILGAKRFQDFINNSSTGQKWQQKKLNVPKLVADMAMGLSRKLKARMIALQKLKSTVACSQTSKRKDPLLKCCQADKIASYQSTQVYSPAFFQHVNFNYLCNINASTATLSKHSADKKFFQAAKDNFKFFPDLKWQYFGTEQGLLTQYPAVNIGSCNTGYDNRFRPWYVRASSPLPKDIVIAFDQSASMLRGGKMEATQQAAITVLASLSPDDRVAVVAFNNQAVTLGDHVLENEAQQQYGFRTSTRATCFSRTMAVATPRNIATLVDGVKRIKCEGETYYGKALQVSFDLLLDSLQTDMRTESEELREEVVGRRDRVVLFLSDGEPTDPPGTIYDVIEAGNNRLDNSAVLMTYALGRSVLGLMLRRMAEQDFYQNSNFKPPTPGEFHLVNDVEHLRSAMGSYYNFFSRRYHRRHASDADMYQVQHNVHLSVPYYDAGGLGTVITAASPLLVQDELVGVVGVDITLHQLFADVKYFNPADGADIGYAYLVDDMGRVLVHPRLEQPHNSRQPPPLAPVDAVESDPTVATFLRACLERVAKVKDLSLGVTPAHVWTHHVRDKEGESGSRHSCTRVPHTRMLMCVFVQLPAGTVATLAPQQLPQNFVFLYHRLDLYSPFLTCRYLDQAVTFRHSAVQFAPSAYVDSGYFAATDENVDSVRNYLDDVAHHRFAHMSPSLLRRGVWDLVIASYHFEHLWSAHTTVHVMWRYFGGQHGVFRIWPAVRMPKLYDATQRPWYIKARAELAKSGSKPGLAVSSPYMDANGGGLVISLSRAVVIGDDHQLLGVVGADVKLEALRSFLYASLNDCNSPQNRCLLIDSAGNVILDGYLWSGDSEAMKLASDGNYHIAHKHPRLSQQLIRNKIMIPRTCVDLTRLLYKETYEIVSDGEVEALPFIFEHVANTNMYVIVHPTNYEVASGSQAAAACQGHASTREQCVTGLDDVESCETPCSDGVAAGEHFNTCANRWTTSSSHPPSCQLYTAEDFGLARASFQPHPDQPHNSHDQLPLCA